MSLTRMLAVMRKEFIQVTRDRTTLRIVIALPIVMMVMFGYVVNTDVKSVSTAVALQDTGLPARELYERFEQTGYFTFTHHVGSAAEAGRLVEEGKVKAAVIIPPDFSERVNRNEKAQVQVLIDGTDPIISRSSLNAAEMLGQLTGTQMLTQRLERLGGGAVKEPPVEVRARIWYNPDMDSVKSNMPGLVGLILQNTTIALIAQAMVKERERGTMEQLIVTPVTSAELIVGKIGPYVIIAVLDVALVLLVGIYWFGMRIAGSMWVFGLNAFIFLLSSLGLGLLISTMAENQVQATQLSLFFLLPSVLLSGYMFPRENMPQILYGMGWLIPLTYFLEALRGVILKGLGLDVLWPQTVAMAVYTCAILALAATRLKKRLD